MKCVLSKFIIRVMPTFLVDNLRLFLLPGPTMIIFQSLLGNIILVTFLRWLIQSTSQDQCKSISCNNNNALHKLLVYLPLDSWPMEVQS